MDRFCQERIFKPLGLRSTGFVDLTQLRTRRLQPVEEMIAPTENCPWRKKILCGEVHDDNAYAMGGVAGHAGLFSSARDVHTFLLRLNRCLQGKDDFLPQAVLQEFLTKDSSVPNSTYALGWDTPSPDNSSSGTLFSPRSVGHLGFTGCSMWWDIEKNCHVILLDQSSAPDPQERKDPRLPSACSRPDHESAFPMNDLAGRGKPYSFDRDLRRRHGLAGGAACKRAAIASPARIKTFIRR